MQNVTHVIVVNYDFVDINIVVFIVNELLVIFVYVDFLNYVKMLYIFVIFFVIIF